MKNLNATKFLFLLLVIIYPFFSAHTQDIEDLGVDIIEFEGAEVVDDKKNSLAKPFMVVEQMPVFEGGTQAMFKFIEENIKYPEEVKDEGIEGRVVVRIIVKEDGRITDIQILRSLNKLCDEEALRVVKLMPDWIPGRQNNIAVPVYYTLPVVFRMSSEEKLLSSNYIYSKVDEEPYFDGNLDSYLGKGVDFPHLDDIEGLISLNLLIEKDGSISDVEIVSSLEPSIDEYLKNLIESTSPWVSAKVDGKPVRYIYNLSIKATPRKDDSKKEE